MNGVFGRVVLALLVAWAVGSLAVSTAFFWTPRGTIGFAADYGGNITSVVPDSPAARAGIVAGDRVDIARTPFESRHKIIGVTTPIPVGAKIPLAVSGSAGFRYVTLFAVPLEPGLAANVTTTLSLIAGAIFVLVGAFLIWVRPSTVTWGFGLFCLFTNPVIPALSRFPSASAHLVYVGLYDVLQNVGVIGLIVFALNFPRPYSGRLRRAAAFVFPPLFCILAAWTLYIDLAVNVLAQPVARANFFLQIAFGIVDLLVIAILTSTYARGAKEDRPRLRWVLAGVYVGLVCNWAGSMLSYTAATTPAWLNNALVAMEVTLPLAVAYAVVRHRVLDIDFFFSRALVYAILTSCLIGLFAISDWLFGRVLENFRLSIVSDALISVAAAFSFDRAQKFLGSVVDGVVFRQRQLALERLESTAKTFTVMTSPETIDRTLVHEPQQTLQIASVALFRRDGEGYKRVDAVGWSPGQRSELDHDDRLVMTHLTTDGVLHLPDMGWCAGDMPGGLAAPVLSIPLRYGSTLTGFLLCSSKPHGEQIDPEELRLLVEFARAGAVAYDLLDSQQLRRENRELEQRVTTLEARLQEARRATA